MKPLTLLGPAMLCLMACTDASNPVAPPMPRTSAVAASPDTTGSDRFIVVLNDSVTDAAKSASRLVAKHGGAVSISYTHALKGFAARLAPGSARSLAADPAVAGIEQDRLVSANGTEYSAPWGLDRIDQHLLPLGSTYVYGPTGAGVSIYIIDTGIHTTHVDFGGRAYGAVDEVKDGHGTNDCNGHGTHVAGTAGGTKYGVAKGAKIYAVRVLDCNGVGWISWIVAGIDWVTANHHSPAVANMSLGQGTDSYIDNAVQRSINSGVTFVVSAGNGNTSACNQSPARVGAAITVGGSTSLDSRYGSSNYGSCVDIFAPGASIISATNLDNSGTRTLSGTSMAAPHVAGAVALYLQGHASASPATVAQAILGNSTAGRLTSIGTGSPNRLLYTSFMGTGTTTTSSPSTSTDAAPAARYTFSCSGLTCYFDGSSSTDDKGISSYYWSFGDGTYASGSKPSHRYASGGTRTVTLTVTDTYGHKISTSKTFGVYATTTSGTTDYPPVAYYTFHCSGFTCYFDASGSRDDKGIAAYYWTFGDGTWASSMKPSHWFRTPGGRTVTLTVTDTYGHKASMSKTFGLY